MSKSVAALAFVLALPALPAAAQLSPGEYQEHPVVKLYPGAAVDLYDDKPFDAAQIATDIKAGALVLGSIEGRVTRYTYLHGPGVSALQVLRNFEAALAKEGFRTLTVAQVSTLFLQEGLQLRRGELGDLVHFVGIPVLLQAEEVLTTGIHEAGFVEPGRCLDRRLAAGGAAAAED